jgi:hypothetical protein
MKLNSDKQRRHFLLSASTAVAAIILPAFSSEGGKDDVTINLLELYQETDRSKFPKPSHPQSWQKKGVAIGIDNSWEKGFIQNFNSPAEPLKDGNWRIWYGVNPPLPDLPNIAVADGRPGETMTKHQAILSEGEPVDSFLSIGNLPEGWRPVQPVHLKLRDGRDRLYFWAHAPKQGIVRLLAADSSDGRRYRVLDPENPCMYHFNDRAVEFTGTTESGLKLKGKSEESKARFPRPASEPLALPEQICNDGTSVYQLSDGTFEMFVISLLSIDKGDPRWAGNDNLAGYVRVIDRLVSPDGLKWSGRQTVVKPDLDLDPIDQQFYYLNVTHTPKGRVGMLGHYRAKDQTMDVEWCFSKDGIKWIRPYRNRPWLERGWPGESDSYAIYSGNALVHSQNKWWLFYTGCNYSHNRKQSYGEPKSVVMFAQTDSIWSDK